MAAFLPSVSARLRPVVTAPAAARRMARETGYRLGIAPGLVEDTAQVVGTLVATSVRQAHSRLRVRVAFVADCSFIEVTDEGPSSTDLGLARNDPGLDAVRRLAQACGMQLVDGGRQLWAKVVTRTDDATPPVPPVVT